MVRGITPPLADKADGLIEKETLAMFHISGAAGRERPV